MQRTQNRQDEQQRLINKQMYDVRDLFSVK